MSDDPTVHILWSQDVSDEVTVMCTMGDYSCCYALMEGPEMEHVVQVLSALVSRGHVPSDMEMTDPEDALVRFLVGNMNATDVVNVGNALSFAVLSMKRVEDQDETVDMGYLTTVSEGNTRTVVLDESPVGKGALTL